MSVIKHINNYPLFFKLKIINMYFFEQIIAFNIVYLYGISKSTLYNWINLYKLGKLNEKNKYIKKIYKNKKITYSVEQYIKKYVTRRINFKYKLLIKQIDKKFKISISKSSIYNTLKKLKITKKKIRKKRIYGNKTKLIEKINNFKDNVQLIDKNKIISIDEVSFDTNICAEYGWSKQGNRIHTEINATWTRYTVISAVSNKKVIATKIIKGSANAIHFLQFIKDDLKIINKYLLVDNARIHHAKIIKEYMTTSTNKLLFNVPYCPEFNPIAIKIKDFIAVTSKMLEKVFSIIKPLVKACKNNATNLISNIKKSFKKVTKEHLKQFFKKSLELFQ